MTPFKKAIFSAAATAPESADCQSFYHDQEVPPATAVFFYLGEEIAGDAMDVKGNQLPILTKSREETGKDSCDGDFWAYAYAILCADPAPDSDGLVRVRLRRPYCGN